MHPNWFFDGLGGGKYGENNISYIYAAKAVQYAGIFGDQKGAIHLQIFFH